MGNESGTWIMHGIPASDPGCIKTFGQLEEYIDKVGFLPLFQNEIPGFSVEEHTESLYWWSGNAEKDPWEWREILARRGHVAYGKFFDKKAGFISREWLPVFANARRDGYDFDALWDDGKARRQQKMIMDCFTGETVLFSNELKERAGFGKGGEKNFDGNLTALQMETYLCVCDFRQRINKKGEGYGWPVALYCMPEHLFGYDHVRSAYREDPKLSEEKIREHITEYDWR